MSVLNTEFSGGDKGKISALDQKIMEYVHTCRGPYYDEEIAGESNFQVWYQLSVLRTGLLSWYPFEKEASVLEIGAGFGGLTGVLCGRCGSVTATERFVHRARALAERWKDADNLEVWAGEWSEMEFGRKFDYIILTGVLGRVCGGREGKEGYADYLKKLSGLLREDGRLLVSVDNRLGLRYFCGAKEPHTNRAFDGLNRYPQGAGGRSFTREELKDIVEEAGFPALKFYYPLPDHRLVQLVYTDECPPEKNLKERLLPYYTDQNSLVVRELEIYDDIIGNGMFPGMANSFLAECGRSADTGSAVYAALSTDRGRDAFATVIHRDRTVEKRPLFAAEGNAQKLFKRLEDLREHGIPVISCRLEDGALKMPYVEHPTLSNYIKEIALSCPEEVIRILDRLYEYILQSSEAVDSSCCRLGEHLSCAGLEEGEREAVLQLDWGPVLKKAYIELIPLNSFYNKAEDKFLFFDQEYVRDFYPAKFILFRAVYYIYCFTPGLEGRLPQEELRQRYGLEELWSWFFKEEMLFLKEVRKQDTYRTFYRWVSADGKLIRKNIDKLKSEEERIADYRVSDKMKRIWNVELQMLDRVDEICKKHGLTYFVVHGTLLGAVRHKGFIPWDDDLDIGMLREDYDRFLEAAASELEPPYVIQNMWTEKDCFFGGYTRIRNSFTTGIQAGEIGHRSNQGIWIDVLPLDNCTADEGRLRRKEKRINTAYALLEAKIYGKERRSFGGMNRLQWLMCRAAAAVTSHDRLCAGLERAVRMDTKEKTRDVAIFTGYGKHRILNREDFERTEILEFAGRMVPVPAGYEIYLFMLMGKDYMKYPPKEERKPKHCGVFDPEKPYTEYLSKLSGLFDGARGKKIILFGAGMMFEDYMKNWGSRYRPAFIVDNDENKWGRFRMGIEIKPPQAILEIPERKRHVIICSYYYKEIEEQFRFMEIKDYRIYVQRLEWILKAEADPGA